MRGSVSRRASSGKGLAARTRGLARASLPAPGGELLLGCMVLVAMGLRLYRISAQSIWYDEAYAVSLASQAPASIVANVETGHPPLYFILLHFWMLGAGQTELAVRFLSLAPGLLTVPLTYALGRRLFGRWIGLAAAGVSATSPFLVYYSQETRMYSQMAFLAVLATYLLVRAADGERRLWLAYVLVAASLLYTHYYGLLYVGAQFVLLAVWLVLAAIRPAGRPTLRALASGLAQCAGAAGGVAVLFLPWALNRASAFDTYVSAARDSLSVESIFWKSVIGFSTGHSIEKAIPNSSDPGYYQDHNLAALLGLGFLLVAALGMAAALRRGAEADRRPAAALWPSAWARSGLLPAVLVIVPFVAVYAVSVGRREYTARYLITVVPVYYLLVALGLDLLRRRSALLLGLAAALVAGASAASLAGYYGDVKYSRDDFRSVAAYTARQARPGAAFVCDAGYSGLALDYYRPGLPPCVALPAEYPPDEQRTEAGLAKLAESSRFVWLVLWQDYYSDPRQYAERWLDGHAYLVEERRFHGGIRVKGYFTRPPVVEPASVPNRVDQTLGGKVRLAGYELAPARPGEDARVTLYWQALAPLEDYTVFVHLVGAGGEMWAQHDSRPYNGSYPTSRWSPGDIVRDEHLLAIPPFTPPADFRLEVGMYELASLRNLGSPGQDRIAIPGYRIERVAGQPLQVANRVAATFGEPGGRGKLALVGYESGGARRGGQVSLTLYWQAVAPVGADYTVFVHLLDSTGALRAQGDAPPAGGIYPTSLWRSGEVVRDPRAFAVPADLPPGEYRLAVGLYDPRTGARLTMQGWPLGRPDDKLLLPPFELD